MEDQKFLQGIKSTLYGSGVSLTATVITVSYLRFPDGTEVVTGDLGELNYATLGTGDNQEIISFTEDITKNANGTTTLNVCTRGLKFGTPYTADRSLRRAHGGGTRFVMSNNPQLYADLASTDNDETITGKYTFPTGGAANAPVSGTSYTEPTDPLEYTSKQYVDAQAIAGANLSRIIVSGNAGETLAAGDIVYFDETDKEWKKASATFVNQADYLLGIAQGAGVNGGSILNGVLLEGLDNTHTGMTVGSPYFLSDTAGAISLSAGTIFFELGYAFTATQLYFVPKFKSYLLKTQKDALAGTSGTPSSTNEYVTLEDTTATPTADKVVRGNSSALIAGKWVNAITKSLTAGETINGATTPVAVYQYTDNEVYAADGNNIRKVNVIGFAVSNGTDGNSIDVQTTGYVTGFTGLTAGVPYFVADNQTLSVTPGTFRIMVGRAVSTTAILIDIENPRLWQRGLIGDGGLVTSFGKDWVATVTGGGGTAINTRKLADVASNSGTTDDDGRITGNGLGYGDTSTASTLSFSNGAYLQASTYINSITGDRPVYLFVGFSPSALLDDTDTQVWTTNHIGFFWGHLNSGGATWTLYTSNANGTTQTINTIGGYTNPFTERVYSFEYDTQSIRFYIDGVLVQTHTTNMPTGNAVTTNNGVFVWCDSGSTAQYYNNCFVTKQKSYWVSSFS
jgi:hypothetical protein